MAECRRRLQPLQSSQGQQAAGTMRDDAAVDAGRAQHLAASGKRPRFPAELPA